MGEERRPEEMPSMERHAEIEKTPEKEKAFATEEMKIEVTNVCQFGRCRFCSPCFRPTVEEAGAEEFLKKMEGNLDTYLRGGGRKIILTGGGEPIDAPKKLFGTLELISKKLEKLGVNLVLLCGSRADGSNRKDSDFDIAYLSKTIQPTRRTDFETGNYATQAVEPTVQS